jgi:putative membrane protein
VLELTDLPRLNACLNGLCGVLLVIGWWLIRQKRVQAHRVVMLAAVGVSALFLTSYLYYHFNVGVTRFQHTGLIRGVYLTILLTHTVLATATLPLVCKTLYHAARKQFDRHRKIARWTMPIWLYVSVTGVLVYLILYEWFPAPLPGA